jgi:hypothetical protein
METQNFALQIDGVEDAARKTLKKATPEQRAAAARDARQRYRHAWRNLLAGSIVLLVAVAAVVWIATLA